MATLSLRLWAQPHVEAKLGRCVLLDRSPGVVVAVDEKGIVAVVLEAGRAAETNIASGAPPNERARLDAPLRDAAAAAEPWPTLTLTRTAGGAPAWQGAAPAERPPLTLAGRKFVVGAIRAYYEQHVLEPSVKGFLSILEKQFPRADLYLFELLQNAVDDGATRINVELQTAPAPALRLTHDGRGFSPLDVNGLASVGMSSKQSRRAAGFMGIGFKACHKRFAHVRCSDAHWRFEFAEAAVQQKAQHAHALPPSAWVLLPKWAESGAAVASGCCFELLRPRGGLDAVRRDLRWLPPSVPAARPLRARRRLRTRWLGADVGGREAGVRDVRAPAGVGEAAARLLAPSTGAIAGSVGALRVTHSLVGGADRGARGGGCAAAAGVWFFLSVRFRPGREAWRAYCTHTRRDEPPQGAAAEEEASLFFAADATGLPCGGGSGDSALGLVHALLPTKVKAPGAAHLQAAWLLSVDRQEVQSLQDNAWNVALAAQIPTLLLLALRHLAAAISGAERSPGDAAVAAAYRLLPADIERAATAASEVAAAISNGGAKQHGKDAAAAARGGGRSSGHRRRRRRRSPYGPAPRLSAARRALRAEAPVPVIAADGGRLAFVKARRLRLCLASCCGGCRRRSSPAGSAAAGRSPPPPSAPPPIRHCGTCCTSRRRTPRCRGAEHRALGDREGGDGGGRRRGGARCLLAVADGCVAGGARRLAAAPAGGGGAARSRRRQRTRRARAAAASARVGWTPQAGDQAAVGRSEGEGAGRDAARAAPCAARECRA